MDATNRVISLCADGMTAEGRGEPATAARLFADAWSLSTDDYERCIAAHYVARQQPTPELTSEWNERALSLARSVNDDRVAGFLPSLHLNIGRSYEDLGRQGDARTSYLAAAATADALGDDGYGDMLRRGIAAGLERTTTLDNAAHGHPAATADRTTNRIDTTRDQTSRHTNRTGNHP